MSGVGIRVSFEDARLRAKLHQLASKTDNLFPLMDEIGGALETSTKHRFETGIGPDGKPWKPSQRVLDHGGKTLVDSVRLQGSITAHADRHSVEWGSNVEYSRVHNLGGPTGRGHAVNMPRRTYLGLDADDEREIGDIVNDYLRAALS